MSHLLGPQVALHLTQLSALPGTQRSSLALFRLLNGLFLVHEAARKSKGWGGEARGNEGRKRRRERQSLASEESTDPGGTWCYGKLCCLEKMKCGTVQSVDLNLLFVHHLLIHSSSKRKDIHVVIIDIQEGK